MKVLFVSSEIFPFNKTGGLGDVAACLPIAIKKAGVDIRMLVPAFPAILSHFTNIEKVCDLGAAFRCKNISLLKGTIKNNPLSSLKFYFVDAPELFLRAGNPYSDAAGNAWGDNHIRYAALSWVAASFADAGLDDFTPDVIHANDWMTGLTPVYLEAFKRRNPSIKTSSVFTIHNLAFQGVYPYSVYDDLCLPNYMFNENGLEFHRQINYLKGGVMFADKITAVSPTYSREIQTAEFGCGMQNDIIKRAGALTGILNGIDYSLWNPETDKLIAKNYSRTKFEGKRVNKAQLQKDYGLAVNPNVLLMCYLSRLTHQKGVDLILDAIPILMMNNIQLIVMGDGADNENNRFRHIAKQYPSQFSFSSYDDDKSHMLVAGSDVLVNPARFEPCGLTQMFAMRYGTLPYARKTGGLADTIIDANYQNTIVNSTATGFLFENYMLQDFLYGITRIINVYKTDKVLWNKLCRQAMVQDFSWNSAASDYIDLYNTQMNLLG
ncbi:MAG: glycogen synthase GlgA [Alphaproteobacteria bacterium]|nr:glycogen synthase GlgA [Alphaproteobacteria bacterium]